MKDLVTDYERSVTERRNFGRTEADLIAQLIQDRDDLKVNLQLTEKELHQSRESEIKLRMIWQRLDFIIDEVPYQNRTKKETQNMISEVMDEIRDYLNKE